MRLSAEEVSFEYRRSRVRALRGVSFAVDGRCVGLLGPNGAGKSTLMSLLTGALAPQSGAVGVDGAPGVIGFVPQDLRIDPHLSCEEFLAYCAWLRKLPSRSWAAETARVLEALHLTDRRREKVGSLSGGLRRRLAVAQALLGDPGVVVLDEPTSALDPAQRRSLLDLVGVIKDQVGVVLSTHLIEDVVAVADAIVVLDQGTVVWDGPLGQVAPGPDRAGQLESFFLSVTGQG